MSGSAPEKPFSPSTDRNKTPILAALRTLLPEPARVLEIGTGTGQHAVHFAQAMPHLEWQCSDLENNHPGIRLWLEEAGLANIHSPVVLDVQTRPWPIESGWPDVVYTANTAHIMSFEAVGDLFAGAGATLAQGGRFFLYGPFSYDHRHTSPGNESFDRELRAGGYGGIRDLSELTALGDEAGLSLHEDRSMPANNRLLVWAKTAPDHGGVSAG